MEWWKVQHLIFFSLFEKDTHIQPHGILITELTGAAKVIGDEDTANAVGQIHKFANLRNFVRGVTRPVAVIPRLRSFYHAEEHFSRREFRKAGKSLVDTALGGDGMADGIMGAGRTINRCVNDPQGCRYQSWLKFNNTRTTGE